MWQLVYKIMANPMRYCPHRQQALLYVPLKFQTYIHCFYMSSQCHPKYEFTTVDGFPFEENWLNTPAFHMIWYSKIFCKHYFAVNVLQNLFSHEYLNSLTSVKWTLTFIAVTLIYDINKHCFYDFLGILSTTLKTDNQCKPLLKHCGQ